MSNSPDEPHPPASGDRLQPAGELGEVPFEGSNPGGDDDHGDKGCLVLMGLLFAGIFFAPVVLLLGGAPLIVPLLVLFLLAILTPLVNPAERKPERVKWIGRLLTFALLAGVMALLAWLFFGNFLQPGILRE